MRTTLLVLAMLMVPWTLQAQEGPEAELVHELLEMNQEYCDPPMAVKSTHSGRLAMEASKEIQVQLESKVYTLLAICDDTCTDMDLYLLDSSGDAVQEDTNPDDTPLIEYGGPGDFNVEVFMVECEERECSFAVGIFEGTCQ